MLKRKPGTSSLVGMSRLKVDPGGVSLFCMNLLGMLKGDKSLQIEI